MQSVFLLSKIEKNSNQRNLKIFNDFWNHFSKPFPGFKLLFHFFIFFCCFLCYKEKALAKWTPNCLLHFVMWDNTCKIIEFKNHLQITIKINSLSILYQHNLLLLNLESYTYVYYNIIILFRKLVGEK